MTPTSAAVLDCPPRNHGAPTFNLRALPTEVRTARMCVEAMLDGLVPPDHLDDVRAATSELVTNALAAAERYAAVMLFGWSFLDTPVHLSVHTTGRWTRIDVTDPEPYLRPREPRDLWDEDGRGLLIVDALGHREHTLCAHCKVMHVVLPIGGELTMAELAAALPERRAR